MLLVPEAAIRGRRMSSHAAMNVDRRHGPPVPDVWRLARDGDFRGAIAAAREVLKGSVPDAERVELHLVAAFCAMRQGHHGDALSELEAAGRLAASLPEPSIVAARVDVWRAELGYFQGRYSDADDLLDRLVPALERHEAWADLAFALRIRIAILLARAEHDAAASLGERALRAAEASGDDFVLVQVLNVLGAVHFDRATEKLKLPHARAHLSSLERIDALPLEADAQAALDCFQRAREVAERSHNAFAAWYVGGNIERLEILLGHAERAVRPLQRRVRLLHERRATYDEIVARSNLAWALRSLGRYEASLQQLDAAFRQVRETGTGNVLLEFLEYDRSIVLDALGDAAAARASYRRYLQLAGAGRGKAGQDGARPATAAPHRPLEPAYLKRADRYIVAHLGEPIRVADLARHCGVSGRTLEKVFSDFRGISPVAHVRNLRLDAAHRALAAGGTPVAQIAAAHGFGSVTTFALEYRKRFGVPPSRSLPATRTRGQREGMAAG